MLPSCPLALAFFPSTRACNQRLQESNKGAMTHAPSNLTGEGRGVPVPGGKTGLAQERTQGDFLFPAPRHRQANI